MEHAVITPALTAAAAEQYRIEAITTIAGLGLGITVRADTATAVVDALLSPDGPSAAVELVRTLHGSMRPADLTWWETPLGVVCSEAIARLGDEAAAALPPISVAEIAGVLGVRKGSVSQLIARENITRSDAPGRAAFDARSAHAEASRVRGRRAAGVDRRKG